MARATCANPGDLPNNESLQCRKISTLGIAIHPSSRNPYRSDGIEAARIPMKRAHPKDEQTRFSGGVRHYHRTGAPAQRSWEEWVDGPGRKKRAFRKWLKILGITIALLALGAIIVGLIIELR